MILIAHSDSSSERFWGHLGEVAADVGLLFRNPDEVKLVCFTGGEDVSPELYGHQNLGSYNSQARDEKEVLIFEMARKHGIPMTGICRGAQFLNAMCGGSVVQDLKASHGGSTHQCQTFDGKEFSVVSSHHQMCVPGPECEVLAHARIRVGRPNCVYDGELPETMLETDQDGLKVARVTEAIHYPQLRIFAVQFHPEWANIDDEAAQWTLNLTTKFCLEQEVRVLEV